MILKILLILIALVLLARLLGWVPPALRKRDPTLSPRGTPTLVRCAHCGLSVPKDEAFSHGDRWYCSIQHLAEGKR